MKTRIMTFTSILVLLLTFATADAALVMGTPYQGQSSLSGIQGLQIDGVSYNVNFVYDENYSGPAYDSAFANAAAGAIVNELNGTDPAITWFTHNGEYDDCFIIADTANDNKVAYGYNYKPWGSGTMRPEDYAMYAIFNNPAMANVADAVSATHAPIPGTVLLLGSSLILIGVVRKNFNR